MKEQESFRKLSPKLLTMEFEKVRRPDMPTAESVHEGYVTVYNLECDAEALKSVGYDESLTEQIEEAIGTLAIAEAKLLVLLGEKKEAVKRWNEKKAEGLYHRKQVLEALKFACRRDKEARAKLREFSRRPKHAVMILDLHLLGKMGVKYEENLRAINFDMDKITTCHLLADELGRLNAEAFCAQGSCEMRVIRNRAFTLLKELIAQAREYVYYLFKSDRKKLKAYSSSYRRRKYRKNTKKRAALAQRIEIKTDHSLAVNSVSDHATEGPEKIQNTTFETKGTVDIKETGNDLNPDSFDLG